MSDLSKPLTEQVTIKWRDDVLYLWPGNRISSVCVVNGVVNPKWNQRAFKKETAYGLLGRLTIREREILQQGYVMCVPVSPFLDGIKTLVMEELRHG